MKRTKTPKFALPGRKLKKKWTGKRSYLWAVKILKNKRHKLEWMPLEVVVSLEGATTGKLLEPCGWSATEGSPTKAWPRDRIEANMPRIEDWWTEENGKDWTLEIRP